MAFYRNYQVSHFNYDGNHYQINGSNKFNIIIGPIMIII